jgi:hypothetical protein
MLGTSTGKVDKQDTSFLQQVGIKKHAPEIISQNKLLLATMDGATKRHFLSTFYI